MTVYSRGERLFGLRHDEPQELHPGTEVTLFSGIGHTDFDSEQIDYSFQVLGPHQIKVASGGDEELTTRVLTGIEIKNEHFATPFDRKGSRTVYYWQDDLDES